MYVLLIFDVLIFQCSCGLGMSYVLGGLWNAATHVTNGVARGVTMTVAGVAGIAGKPKDFD